MVGVDLVSVSDAGTHREGLECYVNKDGLRLCSIAKRKWLWLRFKESYILVESIRQEIERKCVNVTCCWAGKAWEQSEAVDVKDSQWPQGVAGIDEKTVLIPRKCELRVVALRGYA